MSVKTINRTVNLAFGLIIRDDIDPFVRITGPEGDQWRADLYDLRTEQDVLDHWVYNAAVNGVTDASQLEGWGDLPKGAVTFGVLSMAFEEI